MQTIDTVLFGVDGSVYNIYFVAWRLQTDLQIFLVATLIIGSINQIKGTIIVRGTEEIKQNMQCFMIHEIVDNRVTKNSFNPQAYSGGSTKGGGWLAKPWQAYTSSNRILQFSINFN